MDAVVYYLTLPFVYLVSLLPFRLLYLLSDFLFLILYRVLGYRRKVVLSNLRGSFPNKPDAEIDRLCRDFYSFFCDMLLETLKTLTMSRSEMERRCKFTSDARQLFDNYAAGNKSVIIVLGHLGNWEWGGAAFSLQCQQQLYVIYHPLSNKYFDGLIYRMRTRFGTGLIPMKEAFREMVKRRSELTATAFIADQTPFPENAFWVRFLNRDTPVFKGTELISKKMARPVVYVFVKRVKRGFYELGAETLSERPDLTTEGEITALHTAKLEQHIHTVPETWLWSHKRWKYKKPSPTVG